MGFKPKPKGYKLIFRDPEMQGLEVIARGLITGQYLEFVAAQAARVEGGNAAQGATEQMLKMLAAAIIEWNVEDDDGNPVPHTMAGLCTLELDFAMAIIGAWTAAMNGIPDPLPETSSDGSTSVEASIPMDSPYVSLAS